MRRVSKDRSRTGICCESFHFRRGLKTRSRFAEMSRHLAVLKAAGLVTERRSANRVLYSLVSDRLATHVGEFLAIVCPERAPAPRQGKKKTKAAQKSPGRGKHKAPAAITGPRPPTEAPAHRDGTAPGPVSATV